VSDSLRDIGEFGLIQRLVGRFAGAPGVIVGPGDDCAVISLGHHYALATADMLVEGRHFDLRWSDPVDVGFKALSCNVSDVAAMGGKPLFALVSLGAPADTSVTLLEQLYSGIAEAAVEFGVAIIGGDTVASDVLTISVALLGEPTEDGPVLRSAAMPGDALCVTGELGAAAAAVKLLRAGEQDQRALELLARVPTLADAHRRGRARVREGIAAAHAVAHAMIDISDGLLQDVGHICDASGVGVAIDSTAIPVAAGVADAAELLGVSNPALDGGDDYELAIAIDAALVEALRGAMHPTPLSMIGVFTQEPGMRIDGAPVSAVGWDHFKDSP
jgi:thiamine-monophosphate kinase